MNFSLLLLFSNYYYFNLGEPIDIQGLGIRSHQVTFHLKYNTYSARLKSFKGWQNVSQDPKILANAGFFFTSEYYYLLICDSDIDVCYILANVLI